MSMAKATYNIESGHSLSTPGPKTRGVPDSLAPLGGPLDLLGLGRPPIEFFLNNTNLTFLAFLYKIKISKNKVASTGD